MNHLRVQASAMPHPNNKAGPKLPVESNLRWSLLGAQVLWALANVSAQVCSSVITYLYLMDDREADCPSALPFTCMREFVCTVLGDIFGRCAEEDLEQRKVLAVPGYRCYGNATVR